MKFDQIRKMTLGCIAAALSALGLRRHRRTGLADNRHG